MPLTKEEEKEFDYEFETQHWRFGRKWDTDNFPIFDPNVESIKSFIANLAHSREQKLIEKVIEILERMKNHNEMLEMDGKKYTEGFEKALAQAIIKIKEIK